MIQILHLDIPRHHDYEPVALPPCASLTALGALEPDARHGLLEQLAVLGAVDGRQLGADELDAILGQDAALGKRRGGRETAGRGRAESERVRVR